MTQTNPLRELWFWERIISPHNAWLLVDLARQGTEVVYVTEQLMSEERTRHGWSPPPLPGVRSVLVSSPADVDKQVAAAPADSIHICDGIRSNGLVGHAQLKLAQRGLRQWVVMETVDDNGWLGIVKRLEYTRLFWVWRKRLEGVLTSGYTTGPWVIHRGMAEDRVYPFAYFLKKNAAPEKAVYQQSRRFRFLYVGQIIERKRIDLLIKTLSKIREADFELVIVGSGPLDGQLRQLAESLLPGRVFWRGTLPIDAVPHEMAQADCLVLPSRHDGWGAVVSEAMMVGTPVICSDRCGATGVVKASGSGGVFPTDSFEALVAELEKVVSKGRVTTKERLALSGWAQCLAADSGARYLLQIFAHVAGQGPRPLPPWDAE